MPKQQHPRQLIVEGESDRSFFEVLLRHLQLEVEISVVTPRDLRAITDDRTRDTKQGVMTRLNGLLMDLCDGKLIALGVVVDADQATHGQGFDGTVAAMNEKLEPHGYQALCAPQAGSGGLLATHDDGLPPVGLWVMPDNTSPGTLEDWISRCRHPNEDALWQHAQQAINTLPERRFNPTTQRAKADVATWLAWQKPPGEERYVLVNSLGTGQPLLDVQAALFQGLCGWLCLVFGGPPSKPV